MDDMNTKPNPDLQHKKLNELSRQEICMLASTLCDTILEESGTGTYHGGIYPGNIETANNSIRFKAAGSKGDWTPEELNFTAPEVFWSGEYSPRADVYSIGMLLYYCTSKGRLPFYDRGSKVAARSRMEGESFDAPRGAGARLGAIISKATAFRPQDRYTDVHQLQIVLDSCLENRFVSGGVSGETVFGKDEENLSEVERMMLGIIVSNDELMLGAEEEPEEERVEAEDPAEQLSEEKEENTEAEEPEGETAEPEAESLPAEEQEPETVLEEVLAPVTVSEEPKPAPVEEKPVISAEDRARALEIQNAVEEDLSKRSSVSYNSNVERERMIAERVKKRRRRPMFIVMALCILMVSLAIMVNAFKGYSIFNKSNVETNVILVEVTPGVSVEGTVKAPEPDPTPTPEPTPEPTPPPEHLIYVPIDGQGTTQQGNSTYEIFIEDVSWTEAKERCEARGGQLAVVNDAAELQRIIEMAQSVGINNVWIGCSRVNGEFQWVNGEQVSFWQWDQGEPSVIDSGTGEEEDYVLLWYRNGVWGYNDMVPDPAREYDYMYSGKIAYVCEYN